MAEALVLSASSEEEVEARKAEEMGESNRRGSKRSKRISRAPVDSEAEREKCGEMEEEEMKAMKGRKKSRRHSEKKERRSKAVEKLKKRERFTEMDEVSGAWTFLSIFFIFLLFINLCTISSSWKST